MTPELTPGEKDRLSGATTGVSPWTQKIDYPGIIEEDVANNIIPWNDVSAFEQAIAENPGQIGP